MEKCLVCGIEVPIESLSRHLTSCTYTINDDDDFLPQRSWRRPLLSSSSSSLAVSIVSSPGVVYITSPNSTISHIQTTVTTSLPQSNTTLRQLLSVEDSSVSSSHAPVLSTSPGLATAPRMLATVPRMSTSSGALSSGSTSAPRMSTGLLSGGPTSPPRMSSSPEQLSPSHSSSSTDINSPQKYIPSLPTSILYKLFPDLEFEKANLLLELYNDYVGAIMDFLLEGPCSSVDLLKQFSLLRLSSPCDLSTWLKMECQGDFCASYKLEIRLQGKPTADFGGVTRQFFSKFLQEMPDKLNLIERNGGVIFPTCNSWYSW